MDWPHAPVHRFGEAGIYFITAGTYQRQHFFRDDAARDALQTCLFAEAKQHDCRLQAWALFANHYHLMIACDDGERLRSMLRAFHIQTALDVNRRDRTKGRQVWFQYRDTRLTFEASWLARLRYTHENAVHHRLVRDATEYPWCSASWFERTARRSFVETIRRVKIDRVNVYDDYVVS